MKKYFSVIALLLSGCASLTQRLDEALPEAFVARLLHGPFNRRDLEESLDDGLHASALDPAFWPPASAL